MENIVDLYYEKLEKADKPGTLLARFYESVFDRPTSFQNAITFGKLVKVYGRYIPFFAILDLHAYEKAEITSNMYPLLAHFCKKRLEQKTATVVLSDSYRNLETLVDRIQEKIDTQKENPVEIRKLE